MNDHSLTIVSIGGRFVEAGKVLMENALNWPGFIISYRRLENVSTTGLKACYEDTLLLHWLVNDRLRYAFSYLYG